MEITKDNYFEALSKEWLELSKKWKFSYSSWSDVWDFLKKKVNDAGFEWIENENWTLWLVDDYWCFAKVKVWSESLWVKTTMYLHAMDYSNKAIQKDKLTASEINKAYQRCMVKAIAVWFGLWLYIYKWEDLPEESDWKTERTTHAQKVAKQAVNNREENKKDFSQKELTEWIDEFRDESDVNHLATLWKEFSKFKWSEKQLNWATEEKDKQKVKLNW